MMSLAWQMAPKGRRAASFTEIVVNFLAPPELFSEFRDYMSRPTHDRLVALRQTGRIPREGKKGRRDDLARLPFHFRAPHHPFTQTTWRSVWTISTKSLCAAMTASMGL